VTWGSVDIRNRGGRGSPGAAGMGRVGDAAAEGLRGPARGKGSIVTHRFPP